MTSHAADRTERPAQGDDLAVTRIEPMFLPLNGRRLFATLVSPHGRAASDAVLYLPPFAEEMNRCRSHVAAMARQFAAHGVACLVLDHYGTGESEGGITDPDLTLWLHDAAAAYRWLSHRAGCGAAVWGIRTGALLAGLLAQELQSTGRPPTRLLFWQPVLDGQLFLNQHLRLRIASQVVHAAERETTDTIRARLAAGEEIEIAGYPLAARMADTLAQARMPPASVLAIQPLLWIEVVAKAEQSLSVPARRLTDAVMAADGPVQTRAVACAPIWQVFDREPAPELCDATLQMWGLAA